MPPDRREIRSCMTYVKNHGNCKNFARAIEKKAEKEIQDVATSVKRDITEDVLFAQGQQIN